MAVLSWDQQFVWWSWENSCISQSHLWGHRRKHPLPPLNRPRSVSGQQPLCKIRMYYVKNIVWTFFKWVIGGWHNNEVVKRHTPQRDTCQKVSDSAPCKLDHLLLVIPQLSSPPLSQANEAIRYTKTSFSKCAFDISLMKNTKIMLFQIITLVCLKL